MAVKKTGPRRKLKTLQWSEESLGSIRERLSEEPRDPEPRRSPESTPSRVRGTPTEKVSRVSDEELFRQAMADVQEYPEFRRLKHRPQKRGRAEPNPETDLDRAFAAEMGSDTGVRFRHTDEYMSGCAGGIRADICSDLHAGRIPAQDHLDMHGMSLEEAKPALDRFIREARSRGLRCVNIIHGRGLRSPEGPVLKEALRTWLETGSLRKWVLAYATAPRQQGGPGATYLLLR